jgi:hypothetical protein
LVQQAEGGAEVTLPVTAPVAYWLDPDEDPPPRARKLLLLTKGGVAVLGHWGDDCVAWSPLPKIPQRLKEKL